MSKPTCFIIQQYVENDFDALYDAIEVAAELAGYQAIRADKVLGAKPPMQKIQEQIGRSSVCVAEANTSNENVYFEMGYASALEKPLFILWDKNILERLPFDISHKAAITYNSKDVDWTKKLRDLLKDNLIHEAKNSKATESKVAPVSEAFLLDDLGMTIIAALLIAEANQDKIGIQGMLNLMVSLGHDKVVTNLTLDALLKDNLIGRTYNGNGDAMCHYYNKAKAKEFFRQNPLKLAQSRNLLPDSIGQYAPIFNRYY